MKLLGGLWRRVPAHTLGAVTSLLATLGMTDRAAIAKSPTEQGARPPAALDTQELLFLGPTRPLLLRLRITVDGKPFRQVWHERFEEVYNQEDRSRAGNVTAEQAATIARDLNGALRESAKIDFKALAGPDGKIDRAALLAALEVSQAPVTVRRRAVIARGSAMALFPLLDTNHDHQLSADELAAAPGQLEQRDFDDDRVITRAELILDPNAIAAAADPTAAENELKQDEAPLMLLSNTTTAAEIADRLMKHFDRNRDGRLTTKAPEIEISLPAAVMNRADANGDGVLERDELVELAGERPDLELVFPMGRVNARESRTGQRLPSIEGFRVRRKLEGGYDLKLGEVEIVFKRNNRDPRQADLVSMRTYDRDNNGYLDANEASAANIGPTAFAAMDTDSDGKVFKAELTSFITRQNEAAAARFQLEITDKGQDLFDVLDTENDGVLSPRELRDAPRVLAEADKNGDGVLNGEEIPLKIDLELVRGVDERAENEAAVTNRPTRSSAKASTVGPLWFRKMDRNNDGDLSPHEFVGPQEAFSRLDANHDGLIDRDEAEAAAK